VVLQEREQAEATKKVELLSAAKEYLEKVTKVCWWLLYCLMHLSLHIPGGRPHWRWHCSWVLHRMVVASCAAAPVPVPDVVQLTLVLAALAHMTISEATLLHQGGSSWTQDSRSACRQPSVSIMTALLNAIDAAVSVVADISAPLNACCSWNANVYDAR
jgi:hypothetical protein